MFLRICAYSTLEGKCISNICILYSVYFYSSTFVCPSDFAPTSFFSLSLSPFYSSSSLHPLDAAVVECCGSRCFIYHCVPREDMFHPPGRVAVPDRSPSVCWLNNGARGGGVGEAERERGSPLSISNSHDCIKRHLPQIKCCLIWGRKVLINTKHTVGLLKGYSTGKCGILLNVLGVKFL